MSEAADNTWIDGELSDAELHYAAVADNIHEVCLITHRAMAQELIRLHSTQCSSTVLTLSKEERATLEFFRRGSKALAAQIPGGPDAILIRLIERLLNSP